MSAASTLPKHVGIILDGNRRWARAHNLPTLEGHRHGAEVFKEIALAAFDRGIQYLSAFVFSNENWSRKEEEVGYLMKLVIKATEKYLSTFNKAGIKIVIIGRRENLRVDIIKAIERTEAKTRDNKKGTLVLCFNYGGEQEIVDAVKKLISTGKTVAEITEKSITNSLYAPDIPPLDLIIRTSGEQRLSGFMLYRASYAELIFNEKFWPDFTKDDLDAALNEYVHRQRRFGT